MKLSFKNRAIHRDFAYFYVGLILAFSFSGIILNHRQTWYPMEYAYDFKEVSLDLAALPEPITKEALMEVAKGWELTYESHRVRGNSLRVDFAGNAQLNLSMETGQGTLEHRRIVPFVGHSMKLHKSTSQSWIWYSDIFGIAMIVIAITGMLIPAGKNGFKARGWKLALAGLLFPLLFLFLL